MGSASRSNMASDTAAAGRRGIQPGAALDSVIEKCVEFKVHFIYRGNQSLGLLKRI